MTEEKETKSKGAGLQYMIGMGVGATISSILTSMAVMLALGGPKSTIEEFDITGDNIRDLVLFNAKTGIETVYMGHGNGVFEQGNLVFENGSKAPIFVTPNGQYDHKGNYTPNEQTN